MADGIQTWRRRLPEIVIEAAMVMFAVLAALGVEEWRERRQLREFAAVARTAVEAEIAQNLEEFRRREPMLNALTEQVDGALNAFLEGGAPESLEMNLLLPRVSTAAWRAAQGSQGAPYFDHAWVIRVSTIHEGYGAYAAARQRVIEDYSRILARRGRFEAMEPAEWVEVLEPLNGSLWALGQVHRDLRAGLESLGE